MATKEEKRRARKWLSRYIELNEDSMRETRIAKRWREKANGLSALNLSLSPKSKSVQSKMEDCMVNFMSAMDESLKLAVKAKLAKEEILDVINSIDNSVRRRALKYRYIDGMWEYEIARAMRYSEGYIRNVMSKAIEDVTQCDIYLSYTVNCQKLKLETGLS